MGRRPRALFGRFGRGRERYGGPAAFNIHGGSGTFHALVSPTSRVEAAETRFGIAGAHAYDFETPVVDGFLPHTSGPPNDELVLYPIARIVGDFAPKSVVASGTGLYFAQVSTYSGAIHVYTEHGQ